MNVTHDELIEEVVAQAGLADTEQAERLVEAVLGGLGACLIDADRRSLAAALPERDREALLRARFARQQTLAELYERVAGQEGTSRGFAAEHTQVVCQVLAEAVDAETRRAVRRHLPGDVAALFSPRPPPYPAVRVPLHPEEVVPPGAGRTLADGRPGSRHPLSEAGPPAQRNSVAAANPHGEVKLSSAAGNATERAHDTLSAAHPGSRRPLSESEE